MPQRRQSVLRWALVLALSAAGTAFAGDAFAAAPASPVRPPALAPITVRVVRSSDPGCRVDHCADWIALDGPIGPGSADRFKRVVDALGRRRLPVLINSPGGLVNDAMAIGRIIRANRLDVAVTRTVLASCPADRDACRTKTLDGLLMGQPDPHRSICASACALVLAAGSRRFVAPSTYVGVHQYVGFIKEVKVLRVFRIFRRMINGAPVEVSRTLISEKQLPSSAVMVRGTARYEDTESYFARMGIGAQIMALLRSAPSSGIYWLTRDDLLATRMATDLAGGDILVAHPDAPTPPAAAGRTVQPTRSDPDLGKPSRPPRNRRFHR